MEMTKTMELWKLMETLEFNKYFTYDSGLLISRRTNDVAGYIRDDNYIVVNFQGRNYLSHRIIWELFNGKVPDGYIVDHIDGNPGNNDIQNLRLATVSENVSNSIGRGSLPKGVTYTKGKYQAQISFKGTNIYLGRYSTPDEAEEVYKSKSIELYGEYSLHSRDKATLAEVTLLPEVESAYKDKPPIGVRKVGNKYYSKITRKGITYNLGVFSTPEEAGTAYQNKKKELAYE